jgi:peptidoglycan-associated lipoprotein
MKIANFSKLLLLALVLSVGATACHKAPKGPTPIFGTTKAPRQDVTPSPPEQGGPTLPNTGDTHSSQIPTNPDGSTPLGSRDDISNYFQDRDTFKQDMVHFEFDKYNVRPSELPKVQAVANYLKGQPSDRVLIEGHCDERGTPEYNRALGERRALSVREVLISQGISADHIQTVSFGEDKPLDPGHNETAWSKNRRAEFILLKPKTGASIQ